MSKMRIEGQPSLEAYIGENKEICLKQGTPGEGEKVITIPHAYAKQVINWLQLLHEEHPNTHEEEFNPVDG